MKLRTALPVLVALAIAIMIFTPRDILAAELAGLHATCLDSPLQGCSVLDSGYLKVADGRRIAFQTQAGFTPDEGVLEGIVLYEETGDGTWSPLLSAFDGYGFAVRLIQHDQTMLHISGYSGGSGAYNRDRLLVWGDLGHAVYREGWIAIDLDTWLDRIGVMLPDGLEIWKGVDYDFDDWFYGDLNVRTPLWAPGDGNCCPSGGWATIHFAIDNEALVVTSLDYHPPGKAK